MSREYTLAFELVIGSALTFLVARLVVSFARAARASWRAWRIQREIDQMHRCDGPRATPLGQVLRDVHYLEVRQGKPLSSGKSTMAELHMRRRFELELNALAESRKDRLH